MPDEVSAWGTMNATKKATDDSTDWKVDLQEGLEGGLDSCRMTNVKAPSPSHLRRKRTSNDRTNDARDAKNGAS